MFKKTSLNNSINIESLEGLESTALKFDINVNPPTQDDIDGRINSYPDQKKLIKDTIKEQLLKIIISTAMIFSPIASVLWISTKELNFAMEVATFIAFTPTLILSINFFDKYHEIKSFILDEKSMLKEINKKQEVEMLDFCKYSSICMNYKNKVVSQKRLLVVSEYYLLRNQIEKEKEEAVRKELYSSENEQEKEAYASYSL